MIDQSPAVDGARRFRGAITGTEKKEGVQRIGDDRPPLWRPPGTREKALKTPYG